jgi:DNA invertase Pin-like site-specific DNA recombinase
MSKTFGYARCSTTDQDLSIQEAALRAAGCQAIFSEKVTGTRTDVRPELARVLAVLGKGDTLVITRLDRLARSTRDLQNIAHAIKEAGAHLRATEQPIDTSTPTGKLFYDMLSAFSEFETALRKERQTEGISAAKAKGVYKGRPATLDAAAIRKLHSEGAKVTDIARKLSISRMSVYRALEA